MSDKPPKNFQTLVIAGLTDLCVLSSFGHAQCTNYVVEIIEGPSCKFLPQNVSARGMSESGEVCGVRSGCGDTDGGAFAWHGHAPLVDLPHPPGFYATEANDLNSSGQIAGQMENPSIATMRAFLFEDGVLGDLGALPGHNWSEGHAINELGIVCGLSMNTETGPRRAFVRQDGIMSGLDLPMGPNSDANDISDTNLVCGWMGEVPHTTSHAFIFDLDTAQTIDIGTPLPGSVNAQATAVNNSGAVCGVSVFECGKLCLERRSFFWKDGTVQDLGGLPLFVDCIATDLNDHDVVIGHCFMSSGLYQGFIWQQGTMTALNDLIDPALGLDISLVYSINNAGQIAGDARVLDGSADRVAVRLTPIPKMLGDYNCDRVVDMADILGVVEHWEYDTPNADFNKDGIVNVPDLLIVIQNWTPPTPPR